MIKDFKDKNPICQVQNEVVHLLKALEKIKNDDLKHLLLSQSSKIKEQVDLEVNRLWEDFLGDDKILISCAVCQGDGYTLKYVGKCCGDPENSSPYIKTRCTKCGGEGKNLAKKA
jgi:hypothetical protein